VVENLGGGPLDATITSDSSAVLLDVEKVEEHRARITVWLKPFTLGGRHYESELAIDSNGGEEYLGVLYTVARPGAPSPSLAATTADRHVGRMNPGRLIAIGLGIAWLLSQLFGHFGHMGGPFLGH